MKLQSQSQYDKQTAKREAIREGLKSTRLDPEEAIDALVDIGYGRERAIQLVDGWGEGKYLPYSIWSKTKV